VPGSFGSSQVEALHRALLPQTPGRWGVTRALHPGVVSRSMP
jgi:hypothetical protein